MRTTDEDFTMKFFLELTILMIGLTFTLAPAHITVPKDTLVSRVPTDFPQKKYYYRTFFWQNLEDLGSIIGHHRLSL